MFTKRPRYDISQFPERIQIGIAEALTRSIKASVNIYGVLPPTVVNWLNTLDPDWVDDLLLEAEDYASDIVNAVPVKTVLQFPHMMLVGNSGSGKSVLSKYLAWKANCTCVVIDPHRRPKDWEGLMVVGAGRDFKLIAQFFTALVELMDQRYDLYAEGVEDFEPLVVIIDEFLAIVENKHSQQICVEAFCLLVREARKVCIQLMILAQGNEVEALKIKGIGSIRKNLVPVFLGEFAIENAELLASKKRISNEDLAILKHQPRPCVIKDRLGVIPEINESEIFFGDQQLPADFVKVWDEVRQRKFAGGQIASASTRADAVIARLSNSQQALTTSGQRLVSPVDDSIKSAIISYIEKRPNQLITPRNLLSGVAKARDIGAEKARQYLSELANEGYGKLISEGLVTN